MSKRARQKHDTVIKRRKRIVTYITVERTVPSTGPEYTAFGKVIRKLRQSYGLTQEQVSVLIDLSRTSIANIELGRQRVLLRDLFKFAKVFNKKPEAIVKLMVKEMESQ